MKQRKDQELSDQELEQAAGGKAFQRPSGKPLDGGAVIVDKEADAPDFPEPRVDGVDPLPDPPFGVLPGVVPE